MKIQKNSPGQTDSMAFTPAIISCQRQNNYIVRGPCSRSPAPFSSDLYIYILSFLIFSGWLLLGKMMSSCPGLSLSAIVFTFLVWCWIRTHAIFEHHYCILVGLILATIGSIKAFTPKYRKDVRYIAY